MHFSSISSGDKKDAKEEVGQFGEMGSQGEGKFTNRMNSLIHWILKGRTDLDRETRGLSVRLERQWVGGAGLLGKFSRPSKR